MILTRFGWDGDVEVPKRSLREIVAEGMMPIRQNDGHLRLTNRIKSRVENKKLAGVYAWLEEDDGDIEDPCET